MQLAISPRLQKTPKFREAGSSEWRDVSWDFAMDWFARRFKESRDATFSERDEAGRVVNRCDGIAWVGSATVANEDAYLITKTNYSGAGPGARPQKFWRARHRRYASNRSNARSRAPLEKVGWLLPPVNERISSACSSSTTKSDASVSEDCSISTIEKRRDRSAD
jgi:hypothetical protein